MPLMEYDNSDNLFLDTLMCLYSTSDTQTWFEFLGAALQELDEPKYLILHQLKHLAVEHKYLPVEEPLLVHQSDIEISRIFKFTSRDLWKLDHTTHHQ